LEPVAQGKDEDWEAMMEINVLGLLRMTRAVLPLMLNNPGGMILNIGSIAGRVAYEGGAAYCASKAGELQITRALRLELCGTGLGSQRSPTRNGGKTEILALCVS
jgi:NADP-dependent 3-hydroxy acid dehydrogenase YdfG